MSISDNDDLSTQKWKASRINQRSYQASAGEHSNKEQPTYKYYLQILLTNVILSTPACKLNLPKPVLMTKSLHTLSIPLALALMLSTGSASATLFDFTPANLNVTGNSVYNTLAMTQEGIELEMSAYIINNDGLGVISSSLLVAGDDVGIYVSTSDNLGVVMASGDLHSIDGGNSSTTDLDEGILFSFTQLVSLEYASFDLFTGDDDFNLTVDGVLQLYDFNATDTSTLAYQASGEPNEFYFSNIIGQEFLFWADAGNDEFRIGRLEVQAVPEPSTWLLLGIGLIGISNTKRRK